MIRLSKGLKWNVVQGWNTCECGEKLPFSDLECRNCGRKFKVDPSLSDEGWIEYRKYMKEQGREAELDEDLRSLGSRPVPLVEEFSKPTTNKPTKESLREVKQEAARRKNTEKYYGKPTLPDGTTLNAPRSGLPNKIKSVSPFVRKAAIFAAILLIAGVGYDATQSNFAFKFTPSMLVPSFNPAPPSLQSSPTQNSDLNNYALKPGDPWDIYLAYRLECAVALANYENQIDKDLICSGGQTIPSFASTDVAKQYIVPNWVEDEKTRQIVCASSPPFAEADVVYSDVSGLQEIDKYSELRIEESGGLLVTAALVSPPTLETATLNHVPDEENSSVITSLDSDFPFLEATRKLEFDTYSEGFCVAHFRVTEMPASSSALRISFAQDDYEWSLNPDELQSQNFLIYTREGNSYDLDLWISKNYSSLVESFNH